jgi:hypothetical protein
MIDFAEALGFYENFFRQFLAFGFFFFHAGPHGLLGT